MKYLKLLLIYMCRIGLRFFYVLPVRKKQIYLTADRGGGIRCNPLYIYRYLRKKYPGRFEYIWEYAGKSSEADTKCIKAGSLLAIYYQLTSCILISNDGFGSYLPKRKNQLFINTWHGGGAYKKSGIDFVTDQHPVDLIINRICGGQTSIFMSSSKKFSDIMSTAKMVPRQRFLECGMPRNDILIRGKADKIGMKVRKYYNIPDDQKIVLYAPTYRGEELTANFESQLDVRGCIGALEERFKCNWTFLIRRHHFVKEAGFDEGTDASGYKDMQELLCAADVFITDYSSTIWDYSLTGKPGFLFVPDLEQYTKERSFYTDPESWAFPLAKSNGLLQEKILNYSEKESKIKIQRHQDLLGNCEDGRAAERISKVIVDWIEGEKSE